MDAIAWTFGSFTLLADRRLLTSEGVPVRLGSRALDVLLTLVETPGRFVSREELIGRIWGGRVVEEINLRVQVAAVRRALGDDGGRRPRFILNAPAKGYCFIAPVAARHAPTAPSHGALVAASPSPDLPALVGRASAVAELVERLEACRLVTIVGPGGVGKSAVAVNVAAAAASRQALGVCRVDLGGLADARTAAVRIARRLGDPSGHARDTAWIAGALHERRILLLLDGCEGVVDLVAMLAEAVIGRTSGVRLLATSREPLRIPGEQVHRLAPLDVPPAGASLSLESARSFASVRLFSERARAASGNFEPSADDAGSMLEICRRLDGIPLAIELAAHRMEHLGLAGILEQLDDGFDMLVDERRADTPNQQSLRASFDWSFANLGSEERRVLCRLSAFAGPFTLANGAQLACDEGAGADVRELIGQLATKSMLAVEAGVGGVHYRLLGATRDYARAQLLAGDDRLRTRRRHAELTARLLEAADADQANHSSQTWLLRYAASVDDARSAFDWLSTRRDEDALKTRLLAASIQLWYQLSAVAEYGERADEILGALSSRVDDSQLIRIKFAVGRARLHVFGQDAGSLATFNDALAMARRSGSRQHRLTALWGLWLDHCLGGRYVEALGLAQRYERLSRSAAAVRGIAVDRMQLVSLLNTGRLAEARARGERALASIFLTPFTAAGARPHLEEEAIARTNLARVLWLQGLPDRALAMAREAVDVARLSAHRLATCLCLHGLCVVASWTGYREEADAAALALSALAASHRLGLWTAWARFHRNAIAVAGGQPMPPDWREPLCGVPQLELMATFGTDLLEPELVQRAEAGQAPWCEAEVLRARGCHAARLETEPGRQRALDLFGRALRLARSQGALAWELRAATSIAAASREPREVEAGVALLAQTLGRFTEGFATPDLRRAEGQLARLRAR